MSDENKDQKKSDINVGNIEKSQAVAIGPGATVIYGVPIQDIEHLPPEAGAPPYRDLHYYDEEDADWFFGREKVVATLVNRLHETDFLAVVGDSGSGKSSVVRAGVVPAMKRDKPLVDGYVPPLGDWQTKVMTPTSRPLEKLVDTFFPNDRHLQSTILRKLKTDANTIRNSLGKQLPAENPLLIVIDQFEEIFSQCKDEAQREAFIANVVRAAQPNCKIIITLRADFYAPCLRYEPLRQILKERQELLGPMSQDELQAAILGPAAKGNWRFQKGLVEEILEDVGQEPGALPLLSHALWETWERRRGRMLTLSGYRATGGVKGAIAQSAENIYLDLPKSEQKIARSIFLRLTELGEGTQDTRRRVTLSELVPQNDSRSGVENVLKQLADARLLTTSEDGVEVAHEALIREWPTLQSWLDEDREGLRLHRQLTEAALAWEVNNRDSSYLYRGGRLSQAQEWIRISEPRLNHLEEDFLHVSHQQQRNELDEAMRRAKIEQTLAESNRLYAASRRIEQTTNAYEIYKILVDFVQVTNISHAAQIMVADPKAPNYLIVPVSWSLDPIEADENHRFPQGKYDFNDRITHTEIVILADIQTEKKFDPYTRWLLIQHEMRAAAFIPICTAEEWLGTLVLAHKVPNFYAVEALQSVRTLADQAAIILVNQRLMRQTDLLYRIGRALNQTITRDDALDITVRELQAYTGAFQCRFVVYEPGEGSGKLVASSNNKTFDKPYHLPLLGDSIFERLSREQKPIILSPKMDKVPKEAIQQHVTQFGADASLLIPAASQQELLGYLAIDALYGERSFSQSNLVFAQTIVDHLMTQLENIHLLDEALHRAQELITLNQVQSNISRELVDIQRLAQNIYREVGRLLDNTIFQLARYNPNTNEYQPLLVIVEDEPVQLESRILVPNDPLHAFLHQDKSQFLNASLMQIELFTITDRPAKSSICVPLLQESSPTGLICLQSYKAHAYREIDIPLLQSIANQISIAIANAELY
ncbi:GAF domain-containing protein [Candidatus Leptofilum sp.]|uniref:nSTAND1 domain-containing NTPase n=1 Tax=Candidatus Leptofilum sp. TaxID=3241576 RepID=UPI003B59AECB